MPVVCHPKQIMDVPEISASLSIWSNCEKIKVITFAISAEMINVPSGRFVKNQEFILRHENLER